MSDSNTTDGETVLKEMVDGLEGVTEGPWEIRRPDPNRPILVANWDCYPIATFFTVSTYPGQQGQKFDTINIKNDGPHLVRCAPENIRAIAAYVSTLKSERDTQAEANVIACQRVRELEAERDAAQARVKVLEEALGNLLLKYDPENPGAAFEPEPSCLECTSGATPNKYNTGLCAHHRAREALKENGQ